MKRFGNALTALSLAAWFGGMGVFSFLVTPHIFRTQPELAGELVGGLFDLYFPFCAACAALAATGVCMAGFGRKARVAWAAALVALALISWLGVGGRMANVKRQAIAAGVWEDKSDPLRRRFMALHGASMTLNLIQMAAVGGWIAARALEEQARG